MNESTDRVLTDWLHEGPERGPREGLERALAATRRVGQRPGWTIPERWIPMQLTMARTRSQRPILAIVTLGLLLVALSATAVLIGSPRRESPPPPFSNGAIVFERDGDLFIVDQLGGTPRALVEGPEEDSDPVFSPQGDRIAFVRQGPDGPRVMVVDAISAGVTELASLADSITVRLRWAPDGGALLASGDGTYGPDEDGVTVMGVGADSWRLYVVQSDGSGTRRLGDVGADQAVGRGAWRPDGRQVAFLSRQEGTMFAFIADADGTSVHQLPFALSTRPEDLDWSPDGTHLALGADSGTAIIVADIGVDGGLIASRQLPLRESMTASGPKWSPDGSQLAYVSNRGTFGILGADGSDYRMVELTEPHAFAEDVAWSPDGGSLVIFGHGLLEDTDTGILRNVPKVWLVDRATGEQTEVATPLDSWQRVAP
jgi:Tol biopolymer transport system component